jgi:ribosome biogenesis GTPase / thiamine phosphate phosphatase
MKKKGLNQRQLQRIQKLQDGHAERAARKQARMEASLESAGLGPEQRGLVISHFGQQLDIEALEGDMQGQIHRCYQRSNLDPLVTGDEVIWQQGDPLGIVVSGLSRRSVLKRPNNFNELKPVAANIDTLAIVIAPWPEPHYNLVDRYLVAAELMGVRPLLVLNKMDLLDDTNRAVLLAMLALYQQVGYETLQVSGKAGLGMDLLQQRLIHHTSVFVGQSGVGKSALVNALLPGVNTLEGELSHGEVKGRHTTTSARLFHLPQGGNLIDSPGIREFGLWHVEPDALLNSFVEFRPFLTGCRFRDCAHEKEPGCQLLQAERVRPLSESPVYPDLFAP